jgi:hypothetical protein
MKTTTDLANLDQLDLFNTVPRLNELPVAAGPLAYKYEEDKLLKEVSTYIDNTYSGHYVGEDNVQSLDLILSTGHATGFTIGNILKYAARYGKKRGYNRDDLLKVIHYAIVELHNHSKVHQSRGENGKSSSA